MSSAPDQTDRSLAFGDLDPDPIVQFEHWFGEAAAVSKVPEATEAMTVATVDESGMPDARMVLLKAVGSDGFRFFTNYDGVKATQLAANPAAALVFHWPILNRQVRVRGTVSRLSPADSDAYFATRARSSQLGAWASPQSRELDPDRDSLDRLSDQAEARFADLDPIPRPESWGGYLVTPDVIEFWQGRRARLHDRFTYRRSGDSWTVTRLAP
ncbi:MAG: pyridoxamine 5'-phosphate oxidase [Solirubrobacterales bacterium]|nr:pyridoxamine 5'-phosphate oxidase [Solirubrobacterales bacterium]